MRRIVLYAFATTVTACATDFGPPRDYLDCAADGSCADGYQCAVLDIGRVCLVLREYEERCGSLEQCNQRDDDCDGAVDEDLSGLGESCADGVGACQRDGVGVCADDGTVVCSASAGEPTDEICNGRDDDCDGTTDEEIPDVGGGSDVGACQRRIEHCTDGRLVTTQVEQTAKSESCDLADNDCDGVTDEDFFPPLDEACEIGDGECRVGGTNICNPARDGTICSATPGAPSLDLCDGLDNDCDGEVDQLFIASLDLGQPCSRGIGPCVRVGIMECSADGFGTVCGAVPVAGATEICDGEDNDCNGIPDDGLPSCCLPGDSQYCSTNVGECEFGTQVCGEDRRWGPCTGLTPLDEVCDGLDNDCNGVVDDGVANCCESDDVTSCSTEEGACTAGEQTCGLDRAWGPCLASDGAPAVLPSVDLCDGADNDCDGFTDEDFPGVRETVCSEGIGPCRRDGVMDCRPDGYGLECNAVPAEPEDEICDGADNDCDGEPDDGLGEECCEPETVRGCSLDIGECRAGTQTCGSDRAWGACSGREPDDETCDGLDNDCDGGIDEVILDCCDPGMLLTCSTDEGDCVAGTQECGDDHAWGPCSGIGPDVDRCDGFDNDCDGGTDESFAGLGDLCTVGQGACAASALRICAESGDGTRCAATPGDPTPERCDGATDEDCDGHTDEPWDGYIGRSCVEGIGACEDRGVWECATDGSGVDCTAEPGEPSAEVCDGEDNDCGNGVDNGVESAICYDGPFETLDVGECRAGTTWCLDGHEDCDGDIVPIPEECDDRDDDCDGVTDGSLLGDTIVPLTAPCYTARPETADVGSCWTGLTTCRQGLWGPCEDEVTPAPEVCGDLADTDCDGRPDGVTFIEDFEDDCAMPEATVTSDVPLDCVPTPVDVEDPSRTPKGERSLHIALQQRVGDFMAECIWTFTTCMPAASGSVALFLVTAEQLVQVRVNPTFDGESTLFVYRPNGIDDVQVTRSDSSVTYEEVSVTIGHGAWHVLSWTFSGDGTVTYMLDGAPLFSTTLEATVTGVQYFFGLFSPESTVEVYLDDVRFASP